MPEIVYGAMYNPMTEESSYGMLSIHKSKENAENVIIEHKAQQLADFNELYKDEKYLPFKFGTFEDWYVSEIEILP